MQPRFAIEYNVASGDRNPNDGKYETFDHLYAAHHFRFGYMDLVGCRNIRNLRFTGEVRPSPKLCLSGDYHFFWLDRASDSLYRLSGAVSRAADPDADKEVGQEVDFTVRYDLSDDLQFMVGYSHFFTGDFLSDTGSADDAGWIYAQLVLHF